MHDESPASAGLSRVRLAASAVAAAVLLAGCAVGGGGDSDNEAARPDRLAARPQPLDGAEGDDGTTTSLPKRGTSTTARPGASVATTPDGATPTTVATAPYRGRLAVTDRTGDAGLQAQPYGDLVGLRLEDDGTSARVTVEMAGELPTQPAEGEIIGIGVDLFRDGGESDYQLYALGNGDGWRAWLQEGDGDYVRYPGTFGVGGARVVFTVPWTSIGGRRPGSLSVFADWSKDRVAVVADASEDHAPDRGSTPYSL